METKGRIRVEPVSARSVEAFIAAPHRIYAGNPYWVPPLGMLERAELDPRRNPFLQQAEAAFFLAYRENGRAVGRVSAQIDPEHNRHHGEKTGFFGFFECDDDPEAAGALLSAAESWLAQRGMERIRGPLSFSINGVAGVLADGFDSPPRIMTPYTHPYYLELLEGAGFRKVKDLYAWRFDWTRPPPRAAGSVEELRRRPDVVVRPIRMRRFRQEIHDILDVFNDAWSENWGFVPVTGAEADNLASTLRPIVDPNVVIVVEVGGRTVGMAVAIPDLNEAIRDLGGKLFPLGFLKLLWRVKVRRLKSGRLLLVGIRKEYRGRDLAGLSYLLIDELIHRASARGYQHADLSWTLEDNHAINAVLHRMGCERYKTFRVYEKEIGGAEMRTD